MDEKRWMSTVEPLEMIEALCCIKGSVSATLNLPSNRRLWLLICAIERRWHVKRGISLSYLDVVSQLEQIVESGKESIWTELKGLEFYYILYPSAYRSICNCLRIHNLPNDKPEWCDIIRDIFGNPFWLGTLCGMKRKPFHNQFAHVEKNGGFWLESECPGCAKIRSSQVLSLARAAYEKQREQCRQCSGAKGYWPSSISFSRIGDENWRLCETCCGTGYTNNGILDPVRLMILADALEEAGCTSDDILFHLRGEYGCNLCEGTGVYYDPPYSLNRLPCKKCKGEGMIPHPPHYLGCWVIDLILGK